MLCNPASNYPNEVDPMIFFQDNDLERRDMIDHYDSLIKQGKYTKASSFINQQETIYGYFSAFLNALENRIHSLQAYLLEKEKKQQPFVYYDGEDFKKNNKDIIWI